MRIVRLLANLLLLGLAALPLLGQAAAPAQPNALETYLAKLQAQPPPAPPKDTKLVKAQAQEVAALASGKCQVLFTLVQADALGNVQQGFTPDQLEWFENKLQEKYANVCYAPPEPDVRLAFFVSVKEDTYYGSRVATTTSTHDSPVSGTITDESGNSADISGTETTTSESSVAVPYSFPYGIFTMTLMEPSKTPTWVGAGTDIRTLHVFQQRGIYRGFSRKISWGKGKHPVQTLVQEAVKWINAGGLSGSLQSYSRPNSGGQ